MNRQNYFFLRISILVSVVFTLFVVAVPTIALGDTYYVASNGSNTSPYDTWTKAATSIQTAINAASNSDTIMVGSSGGHGAGTYTENVVVNKQVNIRSENGNSTTTIQVSDSESHVFEVTSSYVGIDGFSIYGATGSDKAGIYLDNVTNCTVENNRCGWDASYNNMKGVYLVSSSSCAIDNNTASYNNGEGVHLNSSCDNNELTSNTVTYNTGDGISLASSSNNTLNGNTVSNNSMDGFHLVPSCNSNTLENNTANSNGQHGILIVASSNDTLTDNTFDYHTFGNGIYLVSSSNNNTLTSNNANYNLDGIRLESSSEGNTLTSNTVTHNEFGIFITSSSNNTIISNTMNENDGRSDGDGIMLDGSSNCIIENNIANNNPGDGIEFYESSNNTIKGNTLDTSSLVDPGSSMRINYYSSNNTIVDNTVINGSVGIVLEELSNYNTVANNTITGHTERGIEFYENASYNIITGNTISNNDIYGIWLKSGSYNTVYLNDVSNNTTSNIYSESSTTTWHSPTTIYYDYNDGTYHKDYLGNYYSDGNHSGSYGLGGTYTIANDNNDDYQLIQTSDYYSLQAWRLSSDSSMYRNDVTQSGGSVTVSGDDSNIWIADQAALTDISFSGSDTWTGQVVFTSAPTNGHTFIVEFGSSTDGSDFTAGGPDDTITADGTSLIYSFTTDASAFSVTTGKYLALKITNNNTGFDYDLQTGGAWSYCSSPDGSTDYTLPVILSTFTADFINNTPTLYWETQSEVDNMGWKIYRNDKEEFTSSGLLTDEVISGSGTTTEPSYYHFEDVDDLEIGQTYYYWLESIDYGGISQVYSKIAEITIPDPSTNPPNVEPPVVYDCKNAPNPVNGSTSFSFTLDKSSMVSVSIYNVRGALLRTLPSVMTQPDETSQIYWNGKDSSGKNLAPGVYFYNLIVNGKTESTQKLIMIK